MLYGPHTYTFYCASGAVTLRGIVKVMGEEEVAKLVKTAYPELRNHPDFRDKIELINAKV